MQVLNVDRSSATGIYVLYLKPARPPESITSGNISVIRTDGEGGQ